ncbi:hypothetical protein D9M68_588300 [compost metagenome]
MLLAVTHVVDGLYRFQAVELVLQDLVQLLSAAGEHGAGGHAQQALFELAGRRHLGAGEGVLHAGAVVGEVHAEVVPGLVGDLVALEVQRFRVAVGDLGHAAALAQCFLAHLAIVEQLVVVMVAALQRLDGLVELLQVQLEPVQALPEAKVELLPLSPFVHQQRLLRGRLGQQEGPMVAGLLEGAVAQVGSFLLVALKAPALVQVIPVQLATVGLRDLRCVAGIAQLARLPHPLLRVPVRPGLVVQRPHQLWQLAAAVACQGLE